MPQDKNGKWFFPIEMVDQIDIPPRIGRGQDGDPIYRILSAEGAEACRNYYRAAKLCLDGQIAEPPSLTLLTSVITTHGAIRNIELSGVPANDLLGPKALVYILDEDRPTERTKRRARFFDPEYVPALVMLSAPGGSFRFNDSKALIGETGDPTPAAARRLFISFGRRGEQNIRMLRIIANPPRGSQVHRSNSRLDRSYHYDYRRNGLTLKTDDSMRREKYAAGFSGKGRQEAIKAAGDHYERAARKYGKPAVRHLGASRSAFERELRSHFDIADRLQAELTRCRRDASDD